MPHEFKSSDSPKIPDAEYAVLVNISDATAELRFRDSTAGLAMRSDRAMRFDRAGLGTLLDELTRAANIIGPPPKASRRNTTSLDFGR